MSFKINSIKPDDFNVVQDSAKLHQWGLPKIAGYEIECIIGRGGMATVYRAVQQSLNRQVAIKVLTPHCGNDPDFVKRFKNEGQILAQLSHPNIMTIYDVGIFDEDRVFLTVEYLSGGTLSDRNKQGLSCINALEITQSIAKALGYAHQRGIIHRDVKPSNIMFREDGIPVLADFGIARVNESKSIHTQTGLAIGSPGYMSPEQAMGEIATIQSDLYGLGVVLYEMLTGNPLYKAENSLAVLLKHINEPIPELPKEFAHLQPVLNKLIAKRNLDRYKNTGELLDALNLVIDSKHPSKFIENPAQQARSQSSFNYLKQKRPWFSVGIGLSSALIIVIVVTTIFSSNHLTKSIETKDPVKIAEQPQQKETVSLSKAQPNTDQHIAQLKIQADEQEQQRQYQRQADQFFTQAQISFKEGLFQAALVHIEQGLLAVPAHQNLLKLREQVKAGIAEQQRLEEETQQKAVITETERKVALHAEREKAKQQAEVTRKRQEADQYLDRASSYQKSREYAASLQQIEKGLAIVPDHEGLLRLKKEIIAKQESQRQSATKAANERERNQQRQTQAKIKRPKSAKTDTEFTIIKDIKNAVHGLNRFLRR